MSDGSNDNFGVLLTRIKRLHTICYELQSKLDVRDDTINRLASINAELRRQVATLALRAAKAREEASNAKLGLLGLSHTGDADE